MRGNNSFSSKIYSAVGKKRTELCSPSLCLKDVKTVSLVTKSFETSVRKFLAKTTGPLNISVFK